jgi:sporulation protein YlmC with PRC-barrel domain
MSETRIYKRDELLGKQVISNDAKIVGAVKDVAYDSGGRSGFVVQTKEAEETFVLTTQIMAFGDVILIKSKQQCPKCGYINKESARFCVKCGTGL